MTPMVQDEKTKIWHSTKCEYCGKDLEAVALAVPELVDEKPDLKAAAEVLP